MSSGVFRSFNEGVSASLAAQQARQQGDPAAADRLESQAADWFDRVLALDPCHAGALGGKGLYLAQIGRTAEAADLFRQAVDADPGLAEFHRQLGMCHAELGDFGAARVALHSAIELDGRDEYRHSAAVEVYNFGGRVMRLAAQHRDEGRPDEEQQCYRLAREFFSLAVDIEPDNPHAHRALAVARGCIDDRTEVGSAPKR